MVNYPSNPDKSMLISCYLGRGLSNLTSEKFRQHFQVTANNPIVGDESRVTLLQNVGSSFLALPKIFGQAGRPGNLVGMQNYVPTPQW